MWACLIFLGAEQAKREEEAARARQEAGEKAQREAKAKQVQRVADACAKAGCPMGSKWCWISSDDDIAAGEVGEVVGYSHEHKQVLVKFGRSGHREVTWRLAPDQLTTPEAWREREAVCVYAFFVFVSQCSLFKAEFFALTFSVWCPHFLSLSFAHCPVYVGVFDIFGG